MSNGTTDYDTMYPSSLLFKDVCFEEYKRLLEIYDKIYEKSNIALAFSGVILIVILSGFDYTVFKQICSANTKELFTICFLFVSTMISSLCIVWAVIQLLTILHGNILPMIDCQYIINEELYRECETVTSLWLIEKYTGMISIIKRKIKKKQKRFDSAVSKIVVSLVFYAISLIIQKGV